MPTSEKIISPGVFTNEIDQSFLPAAIGDIGAAVIGPTVKGPAMIPTVVGSMGEFEQIFGEVLVSGSTKTTYLTSEAARNYLKHGNKLTVIRILDGAYTPAVGNIPTGSGAQYTGSSAIGHKDNTAAAISFKLHTHNQGEILNNRAAHTALGSSAATASLTFFAGDRPEIGDTLTLVSLDGTSVTYTWVSAGNESAADAKVHASNTTTTQVDSLNNAIVHANNHSGKFTCVQLESGLVLSVENVLSGSEGNQTPTVTGATAGQLSASNFDGGVSVSTGTDGILTSGSANNVRWEVAKSNHKKGTFNLLIRRGNDTHRQKQILETWNNLSIDANSPNYIAKVMGDQKPVLTNPGTTDAYIAYSGSHVNKSKYVRVEVTKPVTDYLDDNGNVSQEGVISQSMPGNGSGSFGGSFSGSSSGWVGFDKFGNQQGGSGIIPTFHENISSTNTQGYKLTTANQGKTAYEDAINILGNQDEYDINLLLLPGVIDNFANHQAIVTKAVNMIEDRADAFLIVDPTGYGDAPSQATDRALARNSSYASMYYPWIQIGSPVLGKSIWVPPSVGVSGVYSFNDKVAHPWFAPAGLNRGTIDNAINTERQLLRGQRDDLYNLNVNPIPQFPGQGVVIWGQKTLQKKASALDRVNVRRLLIKLRKFVASTSRFLVFEQNNTKTRNRFLNIVNPYMEQVQSNSGLNAFKIVMDETNNTPDIVDRNILYGQIFVQPTRTAEFIVLDFTVQPSGATFPE